MERMIESRDIKHMACVERIKQLEEENKKLKSDLSECECSMHFENDEVGYRKRECKKLKEELKYYKEKSEFLNKVIVKHQEENEDLKQIIKLFKNYEEGKERLEGMLKDIGEITSIKDGPITYRKDSTGKWVADGEPPYVLC